MVELNEHKAEAQTESAETVSPGEQSGEQSADQARASRRRLLKTGASVAPLVITLSAGNAWATGLGGGVNPGLVSDGRCFANLYENIDALDLQVQDQATNQVVDFDKQNAAHWLYLKDNASHADGLSCLTSITTTALTQKLTEIGGMKWGP